MKLVGLQRVLRVLGIVGGSAFMISSQTWAEETAVNNNDGVDVIVVTGERVERSLLQTASSVAVFDEDRLLEQVGDRIEQVLDFVPNLQAGASDIGPAIRGQDTTGVLIGANAFLGGTRPRATLQIDGRALSFNEFVYGLSPIWDVERIEVFRGPQTTTQGRNAIAGAIFIETKDPTFDFEGAARAIVGNHETYQASAAVSGPLVQDQLAARISVDWRDHESWMNYTAPDVFNGADRENDSYVSARGKLLMAPDGIPDLEMLLTYSHLESNVPQNETADVPYEDRIQSLQNGAHWDTRVDTIILDTNYSFSSSWDGSLIGTFADSKVERFAPPGQGDATIDNREFSVEGLLRFDQPGGRLRGLFGVSYFATDQDEVSDLSAFLGFGDFEDRQRSVGVFAESTLDITQKLHITVGGRWQQDNQDRSGTLGFVNLDYDETFSAFLPKVEIGYDVSDRIVVGALARKGFNPGGTSISFITGNIDDFDKETLWTYELFARSSLLDGDLALSGNLFYTDFKDAQRPLTSSVSLPAGGFIFATEFDNAPSAKSYGVEVDGVWSPNQILQIRGALGYLDTEITETLFPTDPILGQEFQRAPKISASLGLQIRPIERLTLDLSARHNSDYFSDDANTEAFEIEGKTVFDGKATYDFGPASLFAYARNATDKTYQVWQFRAGNSSLGDPREFGLGLEVRF